MPLTAADKTNVKALWAPVTSSPEEFGAECLERLFCVFPETKTYFPNYDFSHGSPQIKSQGRKIAEAVTKVTENMDDVAGTLCALSTLHAEKLRVDPVNFAKLRECILVTLAAHHGGLIKPDIMCSMDKVLCLIGRVLTSKYR